MEDYNWKKELKKTTIEMCDGAYSIGCMAIVALAIKSGQTQEELEAFNMLFTWNNGGLLFVLFVGLALCGFALRILITGIYKLTVVLFRLIKG